MRCEFAIEGENSTGGIILRNSKSEAIVLYAPPEDDSQIFASTYKLHSHTEEDLAAELQRERRAIVTRQALESDVRTAAESGSTGDVNR
ncbi:MAG: hypothetical protein ACRDFS_11205 [Chloroflexota bacterium]